VRVAVSSHFSAAAQLAHAAPELTCGACRSVGDLEPADDSLPGMAAEQVLNRTPYESGPSGRVQA